MDTLRFNHVLHSIADAGMDLLRTRLRTSKDRSKSLPSLCVELLSTKGEASGIAIARDIVNQYRELDEVGQIEFFNSINDWFGVDQDAVVAAAAAYCDAQDFDSLRHLTKIVESKRQELFRRINMAPGGTGTIVQMRTDLLRVLKRHPHLSVVDFDLHHLLASWFNRGFLELKQIDWESAAITLEKLIQYDSVHEIEGWDDLRSRLADDRCCFAFFHPTLPNEPLIFVEVALVKGLSESINPIIDANRAITNPQTADTAIFYSINNCLQGLNGISFGNLLIKQVVQQLSQEFPNISHFSTLSPVPGFQEWFKSTLDEDNHALVSRKERDILAQLESKNWFEDKMLAAALEPILLKLCAYYLICAKKCDEPLDPVARFHLRNGARLERINWLGDCSPNGVRQSAGMLVNYVYDPDSIVQNHERYVKDRKFAVSKSIVERIPQEFRTDKKKKSRKR